MTLFNIMSGIIYTKGLGKRERLQVYGLAVIFLALLYNSPAGLVLYWTMNNLYSLMKNVCMKLLTGRFKLKPINLRRFKKTINAVYENNKKNAGGGVYAAEVIFLTAFMGGIIPLNVLNASPVEFNNDIYCPLDIIWEVLTVYIGIFLVWGMIVFIFMGKKVRYYFSLIVFVLIGIFIVDHMGFGHNLGNMSALLVYDKNISYSMLEKIINICLVCITAAVLFFISIKHGIFMKKMLQILAFSAVIMFILNFMKLKNQTDALLARIESNANIEKNENISDGEAQDKEKILTLSKNGKNVIVVMLDRAINGYVPFIFDENPELKLAFDGFVYYPNTLSFGGHTNFAAPALFGGYEYTPTEMNKRENERLKDKHNEALLVLPSLFSNEGYDVTVCDPPYAGSYDWTPDLSLYDNYENVKAYVLSGKYTDYSLQEYNTSSYRLRQKKAFLSYSMVRVAPVAIQEYLYSDGYYCMTWQPVMSFSFLNEYGVLKNMVKITEFTETDNGNLILFQNGTTHEPQLIKESISFGKTDADYNEETRVVNGRTLTIENRTQDEHYQSNMAAMTELANWLSYIKTNGCWDNTRIIIVSDHGYNLGNFDYMVFNDLDIEFFNPLLMVKDFDASGFTVDDCIMTNADVPVMAMEGIIDSPINPFTGKRITNEAKNDTMLVTTSNNWVTGENNGNVFDTSDAPWYEVTGDNIFDESNWKKVE